MSFLALPDDLLIKCLRGVPVAGLVCCSRQVQERVLSVAVRSAIVFEVQLDPALATEEHPVLEELSSSGTWESHLSSMISCGNTELMKKRGLKRPQVYHCATEALGQIFTRAFARSDLLQHALEDFPVKRWLAKVRNPGSQVALEWSRVLTRRNLQGFHDADAGFYICARKSAILEYLGPGADRRLRTESMAVALVSHRQDVVDRLLGQGHCKGFNYPIYRAQAMPSVEVFTADPHAHTVVLRPRRT